MKLRFTLIVLVIFFLNENFADPPRKVFLSVYYESKCPDSKNFILQQLVPAMKILRHHLSLRFVPFGKARSINLGEGGFECQHGPTECLGNIVQDCALDFMRDWTDQQKLDYVACEMETEAGTDNDMMIIGFSPQSTKQRAPPAQCVKRAGIPTDVVEKCMNSSEGKELQLTSEYLTMLVRPKFIPTVLIDGMFEQDFQDAAQTDLIGAICSVLTHTRICLDYHNRQAMMSILSSLQLLD